MTDKEQQHGAGTERSQNDQGPTHKQLLLRRKFLKLGAAGGAALLASAYVKPSFLSVGAGPAYAQGAYGGSAGCTPGFWKNHWEEVWPSGYSTGDLFVDAFDIDMTPEWPYDSDYEAALGNKTLLEVLEQGGGCEKALGRHGVAALLNAAKPLTGFLLTEAQVRGMVKGALETPCADLADVKDELEGLNEQTCPLGRVG